MYMVYTWYIPTIYLIGVPDSVRDIMMCAVQLTLRLISAPGPGPARGPLALIIMMIRCNLKNTCHHDPGPGRVTI